MFFTQERMKETQSSFVPLLLGFHPALFFAGAFPVHRKALNIFPCHPSMEGHTLHLWSLSVASDLN